MPEYAQVQTYATCDEHTFTNILHRYKTTLEQIGCDDQRVMTWLTQLTWPYSDDSFGDIYAYPFILSPGNITEIECVGMDVSLYVRSAAISIEEQPAWVAFNLLFDAATLKEHAISTYKAGSGGSLWHIMSELAATFREVGVYFTDEWQDNRSWRAVVEGTGDPWLFDLAIFPRELANHFEMVPPGFQGTVVEQGFGFAQANRWETLPWLEAQQQE
jgi:hypothetical protein